MNSSKKSSRCGTSDIQSNPTMRRRPTDIRNLWALGFETLKSCQINGPQQLQDPHGHSSYLTRPFISWPTSTFHRSIENETPPPLSLIIISNVVQFFAGILSLSLSLSLSIRILISFWSITLSSLFYSSGFQENVTCSIPRRFSFGFWNSQLYLSLRLM